MKRVKNKCENHHADGREGLVCCVPRAAESAVEVGLSADVTLCQKAQCRFVLAARPYRWREWVGLDGNKAEVFVVAVCSRLTERLGVMSTVLCVVSEEALKKCVPRVVTLHHEVAEHFHVVDSNNGVMLVTHDVEMDPY